MSIQLTSSVFGEYVREMFAVKQMVNYQRSNLTLQVNTIVDGKGLNAEIILGIPDEGILTVAMVHYLRGAVGIFILPSNRYLETPGFRWDWRKTI